MTSPDDREASPARPAGAPCVANRPTRAAARRCPGRVLGPPAVRRREFAHDALDAVELVPRPPPGGRTAARTARGQRPARRTSRAAPARGLAGHDHRTSIGRSARSRSCGDARGDARRRGWASRRRRTPAPDRARSGRCRRRGSAGAASAAAWDRTRSASKLTRTRRGTSPRAASRSPSSRASRSRIRRIRVRGSVPWLAISSRFQPAPMPKLETPAAEMVQLATSLAVTIGSRSAPGTPGADPQRAGAASAAADRDERVVDARVLARQRRSVLAAAPRRLPAGGDVGVLGPHQPAMAALLHQPRELVRPTASSVGK